MRSWILFLLSACTTAGIILLFSLRFFNYPALWTFAPFGGVWSNAPDFSPSKKSVFSDALSGITRIQYDKNDIPHVFAASDEDLYFAQGWTTARDRLWQMDFEARLGLGELAAVMGPKALKEDEFFTGLQLREAAQASLQVARENPKTWAMLKAYAKGVNFYIQSLNRRSLPIEFKLLGYKPSPWTPLKSEIIAKLMQFWLSSMNQDLAMTRTYAKLGPKSFNKLFPKALFDQDPSIPGSQHFKISPPIPKPPASVFLPPLHGLDQRAVNSRFPNYHAQFGSNCWAVMGAKTRSGNPILANDTHLNYTLPGMWYEIQLHSTGLNVFGVSIPGTPGIVLGFNNQVAWGVTNGYDDVADWYYIRFKDQSRNYYRYNHHWMPVQKTTTVIRVRGQNPVRQTVVRTIQGPIVNNPGTTPIYPEQPVGMAFNWIGYQPANDFWTFEQLDQAGSVQDCQAAVSTYVSPSQNFTCIDRDGNLGYWHAGQIPVKWPGQGELISDGSNPAYNWHGWIPFANLPHIIDPQTNYIFSANQPPVGSRYPYDLNNSFPDSFRAIRIDQLLKSASKITLKSMRQMQSDTHDLFAAQLSKLFLQNLNWKNLQNRQLQAARRLQNWSGDFKADSSNATIFYLWWKNFDEMLWQAQIGDDSRYAWPSRAETLNLVWHEPNSNWFKSDGFHSLSDLVTQSFEQAFLMVNQRFGARSSNWPWGQFLENSMPHILHIPGFENHYVMGGSPNAIDANFDEHGPVWRMVVEMGPRIKAQAIIPGGQSGNPASKWYDNETSKWARGQLHKVIFLNAPMRDSDLRLRQEVVLK